MNYIINNQKISLTQKDLLAQGGEGAVYVKNNTAYKIYLDQSKCIPIGKIQELSAINNPNIIKPIDIIYNSSGQPVGYTMKYLSKTEALCKIFTKTFKDQFNISPQMTFGLVRKLQALVEHTHSKDILVVDLNELNYLLSSNLDEIFAIDVDSYQTKSFPATAIMENIRDRQVKNNKFTKESDWFSFAIIAFNMMIGIHPYKGKHPSVKKWTDRMDQNISVFDSSVSIPSLCNPFSAIPYNYLQWFKAIFVEGKRLHPPTGEHDVITLAPKVSKISGNNNFIIEELFETLSDIIQANEINKRWVLTQSNGLVINNNYISNIPADSKIISLPQKGIIIAATQINNNIRLFNATLQTPINANIIGTDLMKCDNRLYVKNQTAINEIQFIDTGKTILPAQKLVANCLEFGTTLYNGVAVQNLLGAMYFSIFPKENTHHQIHIKELDQYKIIDAKYEKQVLFVIGSQNGKYDKFIIRFSSTFAEYDTRVVPDIQYTGINFTVLDNKLCIHITEDENLEIFPAVRGQTAIKEVIDPMLSGDIKLFSNGVQTLFHHKNKIFSIKLR